ncbi:MAG: hypothetical protein HZA90_25840 [Verrucomicrobia bacterium]|nr:hypothetical protein [Verrucomicrobiota bacterium]
MVAALLLGFGVKCLFDGRRLRQEFEVWKTARPVDAEVDLSIPGKFLLPFQQACSSSHGEILALRLPMETLRGTSVTQLLAGLQAQLEISMKPGTTVVASAMSQVWWGEETLDDAIPIFSVVPFRKGAYEATVTVTEGAPALKGVKQRLEGRYQLCGLERMPAALLGVVGIASAGIGGIAGLIVFFRAAGDRRKRCLGQERTGFAG